MDLSFPLEMSCPYRHQYCVRPRDNDHPQCSIPSKIFRKFHKKFAFTDEAIIAECLK